MKSWKRALLFTVVLGSLAGVAAATMGEEEAPALLCCSKCENDWARCMNTYGDGDVEYCDGKYAFCFDACNWVC